jgi:1-acyl-sn-glycerol-3-phosphate acyltransferase
MLKLISYPLSIIYSFLFLLSLVIFHPLQWIAFNLFGYQAHKNVVDILQFCLLRCQNILGTRFSFNNPNTIGTDRPLIIVSNHQSMMDIPPIIWYMRKHHPKFISKNQLGRGIPSVSYNLRHGGSVLIDREKPAQALKNIINFANYIETNKRAAVIFPEGTRSKNGHPKVFQPKGLLTLFRRIPSALVVPITINNSWKTTRYGKFPLGLGSNIKFTVHPPLKVSDYSTEELLNIIEKQITADIVND